MNTEFDMTLAGAYKSGPQQIRVMSEAWIIENAYCANCGHRLVRFPNNNPFADAYCPDCREEYEAKCSKKELSGKLIDGSYFWMMKKINTGVAPNLLHIHYNPKTLHVIELTLIPRQFLVGDLVIKRPPLSSSARRKGWVGCMIDSDRLPESAKIKILDAGRPQNPDVILEMYNRVRFVQFAPLRARSWRMDVMRCIETLAKKEFTLQEMLKFVPLLSSLHPENHHITEKIRQQLQFLRNAGYIKFLTPGHYQIC